MADAMDIDDPVSPDLSDQIKGKTKDVVKKRFEVKKWNAVALWAWGAFLIFRRLIDDDLLRILSHGKSGNSDGTS